MRPVAAVLLVALLAAGPAGCRSEQRSAAEPPAGAGSAPAAEDPLAEIMHAKLDHARAILKGLVVADFPGIERNATALRRLSEDSAWMVTDSVTYVVASERFREVVGDMAEHARAEDLAAATDDFAAMAQTCVACHTYLRRERLEGDFPDKVSLLPGPRGAGDPLALLPESGLIR